MLRFSSTLIAALLLLVYYVEGNSVYKLDIHTSSEKFAGTIDFVHIRLSGMKRDENGYFRKTFTKWHQLGGRSTTFETGSIEHFHVEDRDIERLHLVELQLVKRDKNGGRFVDDWIVNWIRIMYGTNTYRAYFYKTLRRTRYILHPYKLVLDDCATGYKKVKIQEIWAVNMICEDINECENTCSGNNMVCENTLGSYNCTCDQGFEMIGATCEDTNECYYFESTRCARIPNMACFNTIGDYFCRCKDGFTFQNGKCTDLDECASDETNLCHHTCVNTVGSFKCHCKSGFKLAPDGTSCIQASKCFVNTCDPKTSECYASGSTNVCVCKDGYEHINGDYKTCVRRQCNAVVPSDPEVIVRPRKCSQSNTMKYGDRCEFMCKPGYRLHERSAREFYCNKDGFWSTSSLFTYQRGGAPDRSFTPKCIPTLCPALEPIENGYMVPNTCASSGVQHKGKCRFFCNNGYRLSGSKNVTCRNEQFSSFQHPSCEKIPKIECPIDVEIELPMDKNETQLGDSYQGVVTNIGDEHLSFEPERITPYTKFPIGVTLVKVKASNYIGDVAECSFRIQVKDNTGPVIKYCPQDLFYIADGTKDVYVEWKEPVFIDNTGIKEIRKSQQNKIKHAPTTFNVVYYAIDHYNNAATCAFTVKILVPVCSFESVHGGDLATNKFCVSMGGDRSFCTAQCPNGMTFDKMINPMAGNTWWCNKGIWDNTERVPDCVAFENKPEKEACPEGMIETKNYRMPGSSPVCGKCPRGTRYVYYEEDGHPSCETCPKNTYQDEQGKFYCKPCEEGFGTRTDRNVEEAKCEGLCPPGFRSRSGFVEYLSGGCTPCAENYYNDKYGSIVCTPCPTGYITEGSASSRASDCRVIPKALIALPSPEITVHAGQSFYVDCIDYVKPAPKYTWAVPVIDVEGRHQIESLTYPSGYELSRYSIHKARTQDSGAYRCSAKYQNGDTGTLDISINVKHG